MNEDKKKEKELQLLDLLNKLPDNNLALRCAHTVVGATRWYYKNLT